MVNHGGTAHVVKSVSLAAEVVVVCSCGGDPHSAELAADGSSYVPRDVADVAGGSGGGSSCSPHSMVTVDLSVMVMPAGCQVPRLHSTPG